MSFSRDPTQKKGQPTLRPIVLVGATAIDRLVQISDMGRSSGHVGYDSASSHIAVPKWLASSAVLLLLLLLSSPASSQENQPLYAPSSTPQSVFVSASSEPGLPGPAGPPGPPSGGSGGSVTCRLSQPWYRCCGPREYDPFNGTCCDGFFVVGRPFAACCGRAAFDADQQGCCNGRVVNRPSRRGPLACCGTVGYDPTVSSCCGSTVIQRSPVTACCGGQPYFFPEPIGPAPPTAAVGDVGAPVDAPVDGPPGPPSSNGAAVCCGCRLYNVKGYRSQQASCCGGVPYDTTTQLCCNGALHSIVGKQSPSCCGATLVDETSSTSCCQGRPFRYGMYGPLCCPDGTLGSCCYYPQYNRTACI